MADQMPRRKLTNLPAVRYCPMCNRPTSVEQTSYPPMIAIACAECGHVHRITDEPVVVPTCLLLRGYR